MLVIGLLGTVFVLPKAATNRLSAEHVEASSKQRSQPVSAGASERSPRSIAAKALTAQLPLSFQPNHGQTDSQVKFLSRGSGYELFLTPTQAVFSLQPADDKAELRRASSALRLTLKNAKAHARVNAVDPLPGVENYLLGNNPKRWQTNVPSYRRVTYEEVYPGIDLTYYGNQQQLEYDFQLAAGADYRLIRLACDGVEGLTVDGQGDLVMTLNGGEVRQHKPIVYQDVNGERRNIEGRFVVAGREIGFEIAAYDRSRPLVIDPTLVYSTYLGGAGDDSGSSIDVDNNGNIYVTGTTSSIAFPTHTSFQSSNAGLADVFVTKLDPAGANIIYSTYIGGGGQDRSDSIFVDKTTGAVYLAGRVDPTSSDFPTTLGAFATTYRGGDFDAFVLKLNPSGNSLAYSTFLGGGDNDSAIGIAADAGGVAYVTGGTRSAGFPTTANAYQFSVAGDTDAYLVKLNAAGSAILYSTLLGGGSTDRGSSVKTDNSGNAYVVGYTSSQDFPTESAFQNSLAGSFDAFVAKINTNASGTASLVFCSYLGGNSDDKGFGLALDPGNNFYVAGQTISTDFPLLNPAQAVKGGSFDAFIAKISSSGTKLYATYLGGSGDDRATGIAVNSAGNAYVTGYTASTNFPTAVPLQLSNAGGTDAFVAKLNSFGNGILYSTYLGGSANEDFTSAATFSGNIVVDSVGNAYVTGYTSSNNFPTAAPVQAANAGGASDAFIAKISDTTPAADFAVTVNPASQLVNPGNSATYTVTITPVGGFTGAVNLNVTGLPTDASSSFNPSSVTITDANAKTSVLTVTTTSSTSPGTYTLNIGATSGNIQHNTFASLIVPGATSANLAVTKTASPNPAIVSANLTYRIVVTNRGPSPATSAVLTDTLPPGVTFISASPTQGSCSGTTTITCNFGSLANGGSAIASILVTPQSTGELSNTASITAVESDPDASDNSVTITTQVTTQSLGPTMLDPNLTVSTMVSGLDQPTSMAFLDANDLLVLEKASGKVQRIVNGAFHSTALDLPVNSASERGLLGIALHPQFASNHFIYLYWTESKTGADTFDIDDIPLLGNRVDRYLWNGTTLTFDRNLIKLRAQQEDANQPHRGNHNGGILRFGPDGKLYILMGDNGRRGFLQNNQLGPVPDDQFGGPEPDDSHLTGFVLRLNDDGSTPTDNPFFNASTSFTGEAAVNIKKLYAYGVRNGFGMAFDPLSGNLWDQENGDDAFDEMNRIAAGSNNGWVETMGPVSRVAEFKSIESTYAAGNLQQLRWPPSNIADTPQAALARLYMLPGAQYADPEFSWKYAVAPAAIGFVKGKALGPQFEGDMFVGASRTTLMNGYLFRFKLTSDRQHFSFTDPNLADRVADNFDKFDVAQSESLVVGRDFGITTDIQTGPNGNLFVVSLSNGAIYQIAAKPFRLFCASLNGAQVVPPNNSTANGTATILLDQNDENRGRLSLSFSGLSSAEIATHIHGPALPQSNAAIILAGLPLGSFSDFQIVLTPHLSELKSGLLYIDVHSNAFSDGEIRGHFLAQPASEIRVWTTQGRTYALVKLAYPYGSYRIADWGSVTRSGNDFTVDAALERSNNSASPVTYDDTHIYDLGPVTTGSYAFTLKISGDVARSQDFIISSIPALANPIDDQRQFVRQQYLDFLNREPDGPGWDFWTDNITKCSDPARRPPDQTMLTEAQCILRQRETTSAAFFFSPEFQYTGYLVYRFYKGALGRQPTFAEFTADTKSVAAGIIVNNQLSAAQIEANKTAYANLFVDKLEFRAIYSGSTNQQYVDKLFETTTINASAADRTALVTGLNNGTETRATVLKKVVDGTVVISEGNQQFTTTYGQAFYNLEFNRAFVQMEYFGYLRRDPDAAGYAFWLSKLNQFGNYLNAELVKAFITSPEYRSRFGQP